MEPDTLKKQTCYRESVYILFFPSLSLSLPLFSLHCLSWQLLDCFTSRSPWRWLLRGRASTRNLFPFLTAIHCMFVSGGVPLSRSILFRCTAEMRNPEERTQQDKTRHEFQPNSQKITQTISSAFSGEGNKIQRNINSSNIYWHDSGVNSVFALWETFKDVDTRQTLSLNAFQ